MGEIKLTQCTLADIETLQAISIETFVDTFQAQNTPENLADYLQQALNLQQLTNEVTHPESAFYFLEKEEQQLAYIKINTGAAQTDDIEAAVNGLQLERIYIRKSYQRGGYGKYLLQWVSQRALELGKDTLWLGAWEHNPNALSFYDKMGFVKIGSHPFLMGDEKQTDFILAKRLDI